MDMKTQLIIMEEDVILKLAKLFRHIGSNLEKHSKNARMQKVCRFSILPTEVLGVDCLIKSLQVFELTLEAKLL